MFKGMSAGMERISVGDDVPMKNGRGAGRLTPATPSTPTLPTGLALANSPSASTIMARSPTGVCEQDSESCWQPLIILSFFIL